MIVKTKEALTKQAERIAKKADEHEHLINKVPRSHSETFSEGFRIVGLIVGVWMT